MEPVSTFPAANALSANLNGHKKTVEVEVSEENPLNRDLDSKPKHQAAAEPEPVKQAEPQKESSTTAEKPGAPGNENPTGPSSGNKPYEKPLGSHEKTAKWILKGWDQLASRVLRYIAKDEFRDRWKLSEAEHKEILEWATESATYYNITVDNPIYGLLYSLALVYSDKGLDAWEMRQKNEKIAKQEEEIKYWKAKAGEYDNYGPSEKEIEEFLARLRKSKQQPQPGKTDAATGPQARAKRKVNEPEEVEVELINDDEDFVEIKEQEREERAERERERRRAEAEKQRQAADDEFDFEKQRNREFFSQNGQNSHNSTVGHGEQSRTTVENSTLNINERRVNNNFNAKERKKPAVETGYSAVPGSDNVAKSPDGKLEPFEPLKQDKRGRPTEVVRCPQSRKLFERFAGHDKIFLNNAAKSQYYYWLDLEDKGQEPKGGFPEWWNSG